MVIPRPNAFKYKVKPENHICDKCKIEKPFNEIFFSKHRARKFGLNYVCKACDAPRRASQLKNNRAHANKRNREWIKANLAKGLCARCNLTRLPNSNQFCFKHWLQDVSHHNLGTKKKWYMLAILWARQQAKCIYTGKELIPAKNASVDHLKSVAKYPELRLDPNNIQWVDIEVNRMKREMDEDYFISLCRLIVEKHDAKQ